MKDFVNSIYENDMKLEIPVEYAEYIRIQPGKIVYHDPENNEQAAIAARMKIKTAAWLMIGDILLLLIFGYVIATKNTFVVISLMGVLTALFIAETARVLCRKPQVVTGRAVVKTKQRKQGKKRIYSYYTAVAVDEPEKTIYPRIPVSKADYDKIQEGTPIMVVNISSHGEGIVLD